MTELRSSESERASVGRVSGDRLIVLEASGNRVLSVNPDGSDRKVIVTECRLPDGIAVDDAGLGRIFLANINLPAGQSPSSRSDIEVFFDGLPQPIDLELDLKNRLLYWTDRGDPPRGNTVNRAPLDGDATRRTRPAPDIL